METAKSLYTNIVALIAVVMTALIFSGMPLFYGIDTTIDVAIVIGLFAGTILTASSGVTTPKKSASMCAHQARRVATRCEL